MRSASSVIHEYLLTLTSGAHLGSCEELRLVISDWAKDQPVNVTDGAVSGFIFKAQREGAVVMVEPANGQRRPKRYILSDLEALKRMTVKGTAGTGSSAGRQITRTGYRKGALTPQGVAARLLDLAAEMERVQLDLREVPTDALLAELVRREKGK